MAQHVYVVEYCSYEGEHSAEGVYVSADIAKAYIKVTAQEYLDNYSEDDEEPAYTLKEGRAVGGEPQLYIENEEQQCETWTIYQTALVDTMPEEIK